jgi:hypothetical protein
LAFGGQLVSPWGLPPRTPSTKVKGKFVLREGGVSKSAPGINFFGGSLKV